MTDAEPKPLRVILDTNITIRANVIEAPQHTICLNTIKSLRAAGHDLWLSRQILREYTAVLTRPQRFTKPQPAKVVVERVQYFEKHFFIADDTARVTANLLKLPETIPVGGKQIHDANIVATAQAFDIAQLITLNISDFQRFDKHLIITSSEDIA